MQSLSLSLLAILVTTFSCYPCHYVCLHSLSLCVLAFLVTMCTCNPCHYVCLHSLLLCLLAFLVTIFACIPCHYFACIPCHYFCLHSLSWILLHVHATKESVVIFCVYWTMLMFPSWYYVCFPCLLVLKNIFNPLSQFWFLSQCTI